MVEEGDDALPAADHVGGHAGAALLMGAERVRQVAGEREILLPGGLGPEERKNGSVMIGRIMTVSFLCLYYTGLVENAGHFFYNNSELSPGAPAPR